LNRVVMLSILEASAVLENFIQIFVALGVKINVFPKSLSV